jgi:NADH dehydrogenase [ubiquinone] 1 alpha subcomplex assembly factor 5
MRAADAVTSTAAPHVHPRVEASALAPLLSSAGFVNPVVDVDRVAVTYPSLSRLVADLRAMGATNVLTTRPRFVGRVARRAAIEAFAGAGDGTRTMEAFEILHFAGWTALNS